MCKMGVMFIRRPNQSRIVIGDGIKVREFIPSAESYIDKVLAIQSANLIAYWPLNETSGSNADNIEGTAARDGTYVGVTLDSILGPDGVGQAGRWDGSNDSCNIFSASLDAAFDPTEGSLGIWARVFNVGVWTDATFRRIVFLFASNDNLISHTKDNSPNNTVEYMYEAGNIAEIITQSGLSTTDWFHMMITWSVTDDEVIAYFNGVQEGVPQSIAGTWAGSLTVRSAIGGLNLAPAIQVFNGYLAHSNIWTTALAPAEVLEVATV